MRPNQVLSNLKQQRVRFWNSYWEMCSWVRAKAWLAVLTLGVTGVLEGTALLALVSVVGDEVEGRGSGGSSIIERLAAWLGLPPDMNVQFAFGMFTCLGVGAALFRLASDALLLRISTEVEETARRQMSHALLETEWPHFISLKMGDISKSLIQEGGLMGAGTRAVLQALGTILVVIAYLCSAAIISPKMTLYTVLFGFVGGLCYRSGIRATQRHVDRLSSIQTNIGDRIDSVFGSLKYFRATGRARSAEHDAQEIYRDFAQTYFKGQIMNPVMRSVFDIGSIFFVVLFLYVSLVVRVESVTSTLVFLAIFYRLAPRLLSVNDYLYQARTYLSWYDSWKERLDFATAHQVRASGSCVPIFREALEFERVTFRYPGSDVLVLKDITFTLRQTQCLGVVGASGSGKSTLLDLATGLLTPEGGTIRLDGTSLGEIDPEAWRHQIGLVMQESPIFHASLLRNIAWGDSRPNEDKAIRCARMAHAWEFIEAMPDGLGTIVGEKGARLSGGQKQRIALARALYQDPKLLILDEATSALDSEGETVVQAALEGIKGVCAIMIVAHRLKTVRMADEIIVLAHGAIAERGSWDALVGNRDGKLFKMAESQGMIEIGRHGVL